MDTPLQMKLFYFQKYFEPLLKKGAKLSEYQRMWFYNKWEEASNINISKEDIDHIKFIEEVCNELFIQDDKKIKSLLSTYFQEYYIQIENIKHISTFQDKKETDPKEYTNSINNLYKDLFESAFRLYFSIIYFYIISFYPAVKKIPLAEEIVPIWASAKYQIIKQADKLLCRKSNFFYFLEGFDNKLRNLGWWHNRYHLNDDWNIVFIDINNETWKEKNRIIMTIEELESQIKLAEKSCFLIDLWIAIFYANNNIKLDIIRSRPFLKREIEAIVSDSCKDSYRLDTKVTIDSEKKEVSLDIKYSPIYWWLELWRQMMVDNQVFDLIPTKEILPWKENILAIIHNTARCFPEENMHDINIKVYDEKNNEIAVLWLSKDELIILCTKEDRYDPKLKYGDFPNGWYEVEIEIRVPSKNAERMKEFDQRIRKKIEEWTILDWKNIRED